MAKKPTRAEMNQKRLDIIHFAQDFNLVINPAKGMELQVEYFFRFGFCPCDSTRQRTSCPCDQALDDIKKTGHCLCKLFWKDMETFKKLFEEKDETIVAPQDSDGAGGGGDH
jgi:ferredoxin-thioredoxin reductase catalytic subunit